MVDATGTIHSLRADQMRGARSAKRSRLAVPAPDVIANQYLLPALRKGGSARVRLYVEDGANLLVTDERENTCVAGARSLL